MAAGRVFVVDDDPDTRSLLRMILEKRGFDVSEAEDGESALAAIRTDTPDIVVLDIRMPGLDGWAVLETIKADAATRAVKVVMISAHAEAGTARNALDRGATAFVTKPFRSEEIGGVVERALSS